MFYPITIHLTQFQVDRMIVELTAQIGSSGMVAELMLDAISKLDKNLLFTVFSEHEMLLITDAINQ